MSGAPDLAALRAQVAQAENEPGGWRDRLDGWDLSAWEVAHLATTDRARYDAALAAAEHACLAAWRAEHAGATEGPAFDERAQRLAYLDNLATELRGGLGRVE